MSEVNHFLQSDSYLQFLRIMYYSFTFLVLGQLLPSYSPFKNTSGGKQEKEERVIIRCRIRVMFPMPATFSLSLCALFWCGCGCAG